ncbi:hypothetical protein C8T65DRAFT_192068 [Cerioporus squamosus]|nr:hypothetical protein C8T65DRAFT_192068 [Cerioporus squamosus]
MDPNSFGQGPPPFQPPPMHGYYHPMQAPPFTMAQMQPFWQPQTTFAPPMQPMPQWVPCSSAPFQARGHGMGIGMGMGQRQCAGDGGPATTTHLSRTQSPASDARSAGEVLADALGMGKELGLSQRDVLEHLRNVEKYKGVDWTAYFLENAVLPGGSAEVVSRVPETRGADLSQGSRATTSTDEPPQKKRKTTHKMRISTSTGRPRGRPRKVLPSQRSVPSESRSRDGGSLAPSLSTASSSTRATGSRPKRGGMLLEFHNETCIPPSDNSSKPIAPRRDPDDDLTKFSPEEKIFFIHYLKWRLGAGRVPSKYTLLAELAKELPYRDVEAWKKHWDDYPMLPDEIYIAARKRAEEDGLLSSQSDTSTLTPISSGDEYRPSSPRPSLSSLSAAASISSTANQKVTQDDLRAMAMYMIEKRHVWEQYRSDKQRWKEFSRRKEVRRDSSAVWYKLTARCARRT